MNLDEQRKRSRTILDQLSVGERFMLMFGRGVVKHDPLRVEWINETVTQLGMNTSEAKARESASLNFQVDAGSNPASLTNASSIPQHNLDACQASHPPSEAPPADTQP
jgi:hypothetical protein